MSAHVEGNQYGDNLGVREAVGLVAVAFPGAQIDMVIDRDDHVANLCEMKFTDEEYRLTLAEDKRLKHRKNRLLEVLPKRKSIFVTLVTPYGLIPNNYAGNIQNEITVNELFA